MRILFRCLLVALLLVAGAGVQAQTNDDWANRTPIPALPFEVAAQPMGGATNAATDPAPNCRPTGLSSYGTIWFSYTTGGSPEFLTLRVKDFQVAVVLAVYTGGPGAFRLAPGACAAAGGSPNNAQLAGVRLAPNTEYSILLSAVTPPSGLTVDFAATTAILYNVTKVADTFDGTCDADCSLREAIEAANVTPGAVIVPAGTYTLSLAGRDEYLNATGSLDVRNDMGIYGAGMGQTVVDANAIDHLLSVAPSVQERVTLILGDLTMTHGDASEMASPNGGAIFDQALAPGFFGLERVEILDNHALQTGGGLYTLSPGLVRDSRFTLNTVTAGSGGGGGAELLNAYDQPFDIESSTFDANDGGDTGGAIQSQNYLRVTNSTFSGNHVAQYGGGIRIVGGLFAMSSTTVAFNRAGNDPFTNIGGGLFLDGSGYTFTLYNNIVAGNIADDCNRYPFSSTIDSHHNHVQNPGACTLTGTGDVTGTDPQLDPTLADNGGATPTHALAYKSPARDAGDPAGCTAPDGVPLVNDQRGVGFPRIDGPACDKGSYEQQVLFANGFEP